MIKRYSNQREQADQEQIKVYIRIKPMRNEHSKRTLKIVDRGVAFHYKDNKIHQLYFDGVLDENASQKKVFETSCHGIINDVLNGNNGSIFVYGQTGTGKTYTMGTLESIKRQDQGLIPLSLNYLLNHLGETRAKDDWSICISFMQIYMEDIYDLFNPTSGKLQIRESLEQGETFVEDLVIVPIKDYSQFIELINSGLKLRKVGNQKMNELSSRSHTIFTIYVTQKISNRDYISSTFSLIDLAGSERVKKTNSVDVRLDEAKFINTSLSSLGNVISALAQNNSDKFVPYRSSKLTRILKDSLTGRSKISVICTLQISSENIHETYSTLLFADRCKQIRFPNQPVINIEMFEELEQEKDMKMALEKSLQKEKEYIQIIKNLEQNGSQVSKDNHRENQLSLIIQSVYKLFGEINCHLKKLLDPRNKNSIVKPEIARVAPNTPIASIKENLTGLAQETIEHINSLSSIAFGDVKYQSHSANSKLQTETLTSILLDMLRQNIKLYETILVKDAKDSFQKEICLDQYQKEKKQEILNKLKSKKLKNLQSNFEEIWSESHSFSNPLTNLLNGIRKGDIGAHRDKFATTKIESNQKDFSNPKEFLKMLTRQESERKHREMLIDDFHDESDRQQPDKKQSQNSLQQSKIKYFQKQQAKQRKDPQTKQSRMSVKRDEKVGKRQQKTDNSSNEIKKLLDSLIASKAQFQQKKKQI